MQFGCTTILQIVILLTGTIIVIISSHCIYYDYEWNLQLEDERALTEIEVEYLRRDKYFLELLFVCLEFGTTVIAGIDFSLCFCVKSKSYLKTWHNGVLFLMALIYFGSGFLEFLSATIYDLNYFKVEEQDKRDYYLRFQVKDEDIKIPSRSVFYYCHMGYGKPRKPSELKGIRVKKEGSKLCQLVGLKIVAGILSIYLSVLCFVAKWQAQIHERYVNAKAAKQLYELYGDQDEFDFNGHLLDQPIQPESVSATSLETINENLPKKQRRRGINFEEPENSKPGGASHR